MTPRLTIRDILSHRSGLARGAGDLLTWPDGIATTAEAVNAVKHLPIDSFRHRFVYSHTMYRVAGAMIEAVSGMGWHAFIEARVLAPLTMSGCAADPREADPSYRATEHTRDLASDRVSPLDDLTVHPDPAGGMACTIKDRADERAFRSIR